MEEQAIAGRFRQVVRHAAILDEPWPANLHHQAHDIEQSDRNAGIILPLFA